MILNPQKVKQNKVAELQNLVSNYDNKFLEDFLLCYDITYTRYRPPNNDEFELYAKNSSKVIRFSYIIQANVFHVYDKFLDYQKVIAFL